MSKLSSELHESLLGIHATVVSIHPASLLTVVDQPHAVSSVYGGRVK